MNGGYKNYLKIVESIQMFLTLWDINVFYGDRLAPYS